jgi:hypothetical protein
MIQLSYTIDTCTPHAIYFYDMDEKPEEYSSSFYGYCYLSDEEAAEMINYEYVLEDTKRALKDALGL